LQGCSTVSVTKKFGDEKSISISTELVESYKNAISLMRKGDTKKAFHIFNDISRSDDRLSGPHANIGMIYLKSGQLKEAKMAFKKALKRNPENLIALNQLAIFKRKEGDFLDARKDYEKIIKIKSSHKYAHLNLGIVCDIYLQDYPCALIHYENYLKIAGNDQVVNNWLIDLKERM
jgi:tetratricopeptide (TPR) repeat protein